MKNQVLLIAILSIVIGTTIKAQTCSIVKSVGKNTYLIEVGEVFTTIYNQNDSLRLLDCNYEWDYISHDMNVEFCNYDSYRKIFHDVLYPRFKRHLDPQTENVILFHFSLYFTMEGTLEEVVFSYRSAILKDIIRLKDVDEFCTKLKNSDVHLLNKDRYHRAYINGRWICSELYWNVLSFQNMSSFHERPQKVN